MRDTAAVDEIARGEAVGSEDGTAGGKRGRDAVAERRGKAERDRAGQQREDHHLDSAGVRSACEEERTVTEMCYGAEQPYVNKDRMEFGALHRAVAVRRKGYWSLKNER